MTVKRMLALDGGGLMGLISLGYLCEIERQLGERLGAGPEFRLRDWFDYISGTSTGAIIAASLALGRSAAEIREFYLAEGAAMFDKVPPLRLLRYRASHRYDHENLERILKREFTERTILELQDDGDLSTKKHLMIMLRNDQTDSAWPLSTNPDARYNRRTSKQCNRQIPLWQLVRASTAAPSYYRPEKVVLGDGSSHSFVDGGLTPHNNPAWKMFQMATLPQFNCNWAAGVAEMLIVSIGTGRAREPDPHPNPMGASILKLAARAPGALMRGASQEIDITCRTAGHCLYGHSIDRELGTMMDGPSDGKRFSYVRYDADISTEGQIAHGAPVPYRPLKMDDVHMIKHFDLLGQSAGQSEVNLHTQLGDFL